MHLVWSSCFFSIYEHLSSSESYFDQIFIISGFIWLIFSRRSFFVFFLPSGPIYEFSLTFFIRSSNAFSRCSNISIFSLTCDRNLGLDKPDSRSSSIKLVALVKARLRSPSLNWESRIFDSLYFTCCLIRSSISLRSCASLLFWFFSAFWFRISILSSLYSVNLHCSYIFYSIALRPFTDFLILSTSAALSFVFTLLFKAYNWTDITLVD